MTRYKRPEFQKRHRPQNPAYTDRAHTLTPTQLSRLLGQPTIDDLRSDMLAAERQRIRADNEARQLAAKEEKLAAKSRKHDSHVELWLHLKTMYEWTEPQTKEIRMTVSLYRSTANGVREIVVQTNAQSLDVFIDGLSEALSAAIASMDTDESAKTVAATLRNAFPVAFAIAGYKAEKVSESKLLTCGFASPDAAELVAQSRI